MILLNSKGDCFKCGEPAVSTVVELQTYEWSGYNLCNVCHGEFENWMYNISDGAKGGETGWQ